MDLKTWLRAQWDRVLGAGTVAAGAVAILLGYHGVSHTPFPAEQIPYVISGAVVGIALIGIGLTAWLSADLRDEWRKLDRLERLLEESEAPPLDDHPPPAENGAANHPVAPGTRR